MVVEGRALIKGYQALSLPVIYFLCFRREHCSFLGSRLKIIQTFGSGITKMVEKWDEHIIHIPLHDPEL